MRNVLMIGAVLCLTACAQSVPLQHTADGHTLTGSHDELTGRLVVIIDSRPAIDGKLSLWDGSGTVTGTFGGEPASATCAPRSTWSATILECVVMLSNRPLGTLVF